MNDIGIEDINPQVETENSQLTGDERLSNDLGFSVEGSQNAPQAEEQPQQGVPPSPQPQEEDYGWFGKPDQNGNFSLSMEKARELQQALIADQMQKQAVAEAIQERERQYNNELLRLQNQLGCLQRPQQMQNQTPSPKPPSAYDMARNDLLQKTRLIYGDEGAKALLDAQERVQMEGYKKAFAEGMKEYEPFFQKQAEDMYSEGLGNIAVNWVDSFTSNGAQFGLTPEECEAIVTETIKDYMNQGHTDLNDIHSYIAHNSMSMLAAAADEKRKIYEERSQRQRAYQNQTQSQPQPYGYGNSVPSTSQAARMVASGDAVRMRNNASVAGGASPAAGSDDARAAQRNSLYQQTGGIPFIN